MNVERTTLYDLLKESTMKSVQIGVLKVHRNYPIKKDPYDDGHYPTLVVPIGNYPLWLNRSYPGSEVRCHPLARVMDAVMGQYQVLLAWTEHDAAQTVMREWNCNCQNKLALELALDQSVVVPKWTYHSRDIVTIRKLSQITPEEAATSTVPVETMEWGEAVLQLI